MGRSFGKFTIRDLLVILTVVALILMVTLPLVNEAREQARRNQCQGRLKQLAVAMTNYEMAHGRFPPAAPSCTDEAWLSTGFETGNTCQGPSWAISIASFMEEFSLFERAVECMYNDDRLQYSDDCHKCGFGESTPEYMLCPAAQLCRKPHESRRTELEHLAKGNYAACMGSSTYLHSIDGNRFVEERLKTKLDQTQYQQAIKSRGIMALGMVPNWLDPAKSPYRPPSPSDAFWQYGHNAGVSVKKIKDGLSKTILLSEVLGFDGPGQTSTDIRGVWTSASMGASTYSHLTTPNSKTADAINGCDRNAPGYLSCKSVTAFGPRAGDTHAAARSMHFRGVFAVRADTSIGFYLNNIDEKIWRALATRAGGELEGKID